jgi:hypothetical protein
MTTNTREAGPLDLTDRFPDVVKKPLARSSMAGTSLSGQPKSNMAVFLPTPFDVAPAGSYFGAAEAPLGAPGESGLSA